MPVTLKDLKRSAFHEVAEIVLAPLHRLALDGGVSGNMISREVHKIIRRLENVLFDNFEGD